jgi:hypothetical protein
MKLSSCIGAHLLFVEVVVVSWTVPSGYVTLVVVVKDIVKPPPSAKREAVGGRGRGALGAVAPAE